jgi:hypothetical protein
MCWVYIKRKLKFFKSKNSNNINHDMINDSDYSYNLMKDNDINKKKNKLYMRKSCHIQNQGILDSLTNDNINILTYKNLHISEDDLNDNNVKNNNVKNNNVKNNNVKNNNVKNNNVKNNNVKMYNINIDYPYKNNNYECNNFKIDYI